MPRAGGKRRAEDEEEDFSEEDSGEEFRDDEDDEDFKPGKGKAKKAKKAAGGAKKPAGKAKAKKADADDEEGKPKKAPAGKKRPAKLKPEEEAFAKFASIDRNKAMAALIRIEEQAQKDAGEYIRASVFKKAVAALEGADFAIRCGRDAMALPSVGKGIGERIDAWLAECGGDPIGKAGGAAAGGGAAVGGGGGGAGAAAVSGKAAGDPAFEWTKDSEPSVLVSLLRSGELTATALKGWREDADKLAEEAAKPE